MKKYLTFLFASALFGADSYVVQNPTSKVLEFCSPTVQQTPPRAAAIPAVNNWSNPATWGGTVPLTGSNVIVQAGQSILLDTDIDLSSLVVNGTLEVARRDTVIICSTIIVSGGRFVVGSVAEPFANKLTVTLTGADRLATAMGGRVFGAMAGGRIELVGKIPSFNWTMLANGSTAPMGATTITLDRAPEWSVGDEIIITSTDLDYAQTEKRKITAINGETLTLDTPLSYLHYGVITTVNHGVTGVPTTIDERAEVGLLTHNIKIEGAQGMSGIEDAETNGYGGHMMVMGDTSSAIIQGVEYHNMGQKGILGRYPMHWHNVNNGGTNSAMTSSSVHHSFNRGTTIHKTNGVTISENVLYDTTGHGYFFEDGKETGNTLNHNLVALVNGSPMDRFVGGNRSSWDGNSAAYWITNPNNSFLGNAAAGQHPGGIGFWYDIRSIPRPGSISDDINYHPNEQPFGIFKGNRAHSAVLPISSPITEQAWGFLMDPLYNKDPMVIDDFTAFKNQGGQIWHSKVGSNATVLRARLSGDNAFFNPGVLKNSLVIGRTGNPVFIDPDAYAKNMGLLWYEPSIGQIALIGYDVVARAEDSVFGNYRGIFKLRPNNADSGSVTNCTFLNDATYRTYMVGNISNLTAAQAEVSMFTIQNPEDSFHNGAPGMFTYTELLTSAASKKIANGIDPEDKLAWWSPFLMDEFSTLVFNNREVRQPGGSVYLPYIQPEGKTKSFPFQLRSDDNGGEKYVTQAKMNALHKITFTGFLANTKITIMVGSDAAKFMLFTIPAPSSVPTYSSAWGTTVNPVQIAGSLAQWNAAVGHAIWQDNTAHLLYVKLHVPKYLLTIDGYTLSAAPPVDHSGDVDVFSYTLTTTAAKSGEDSFVATVVVKDKAGRLAANKTVTFAWSGVVQLTVSAVTNASGSVRFTTKTKKAGIITGTVTGISGVYDPTIYPAVVSKSITVK